MTDEKIIAEALYWYGFHRHRFANAMAQKTYRSPRTGKPATKEEVNDAIDISERVDRLVLEWREKAG